jgi:hypothetical protein
MRWTRQTRISDNFGEETLLECFHLVHGVKREGDSITMDTGKQVARVELGQIWLRNLRTGDVLNSAVLNRAVM